MAWAKVLTWTGWGRIGAGQGVGSLRKNGGWRATYPNPELNSEAGYGVIS